LVRCSTTAILLALALALAGCVDLAPSPSAGGTSSSAAPPTAGASTTAPDLSVIACGTDDPTDVGELTGAWSGNDHGVYYIRQVGECVWWFGTEIVDLEPGLTGQPGFANVASGRVDGSQVVVEWADVPVGDILGGGGLTFVYDDQNGTLTLIEQRGDWVPFGGSVLTRIEPTASPGASASASPDP
jgi:hypothetical protein